MARKPQGHAAPAAARRRARAAAQKKAQRPARAPSPKFVHTRDEDCDVTPPQNRVYAWVITYRSPKYRPASFAFDAASRHLKPDDLGTGFGIKLSQSSTSHLGVSGIHVDARAESMTGYDMPLIIDDACITGPALEQFAIALLATVREVKRTHPELWRQGHRV